MIDLDKLERHFRHGEKDPAGWPERDVLEVITETRRLLEENKRLAEEIEQWRNVARREWSVGFREGKAAK